MSFVKYKKILRHAAIQSHLHIMDKDKYVEVLDFEVHKRWLWFWILHSFLK